MPNVHLPIAAQVSLLNFGCRRPVFRCARFAYNAANEITSAVGVNYNVCTWKNEVTVYHYHYVNTKNADGTVTTVETITTATFSTAKGNEGQFLRATTQTVIFGKGTSYFGDAGKVQEISYGQAVRAMGPSEMAKGAASAFPTREGQFVRAVVSDARAHPGKYAVAVGELALVATPVPEAYETAKAGFDVVAAAAHLIWELKH
jgi:hypothetical protein